MNREFEIVFVDDGSRDETPQRLAAARARHPRLRVLRLKQNCGQSTAIWTGVRAAKFPWIVTLDGDGQNDPADIPRLIEKFAPAGGKVAPMVCGVRKGRQDSWLRRVSSRIANGVRRRLLDDGTPDTGCTLKLFTRESYLALPFFDHMHRFVPALHRRNGGEIILVDVHHRARSRGASKYGLSNRLWVGIVDLIGVLWLLRRNKIPDIESKD